MNSANLIHITTGIPADPGQADPQVVTTTKGNLYCNDVVLFGAIDGVNKDFSLPDRVLDGTLSLFMNGVRLSRGIDFDYSGSAVMFRFAPEGPVGDLPADVLRADYFAERTGC